MAVSFPTNSEVLEQYPNLARYFKGEAEYERSDKQIFRLLDNLHYSRIERLVDFLEEMASNDRYHEFIYQKLNTSDLLQFRTGLHEIYLLQFLLNNEYTVRPFDDKKGSRSVPEFRAVHGDLTLLCELYSPVELYGYELFYEELRTGIKYIDLPVGFEIRIELINNYPFNDPYQYYYPYKLHDIYSDDGRRKKKVEQILHEVREELKELHGEVNFNIANRLQLHLRIDRKNEEEGRLIVVGQGTHSHDTGQYFEMAECNQKGYYSKVYAKVEKEQLLVEGASDAAKVLFICTNGFPSGDGYDLVKNEGEGHYSKEFYENQRVCFQQNIDPSKVDLIFPIIAGIGEDFYVGSSLFNPGGIDTRGLWTNPPQPDPPEVDATAPDDLLDWYDGQFGD